MMRTMTTCPNCGHSSHDGLHCHTLLPEGPCACSWPEPDNFKDLCQFCEAAYEAWYQR